MTRLLHGGQRSIVVFGLLSVQAVLLAHLGWTMSPTPTEVGHMGATLYQWNTLRFDVFHVNPPLMRLITGWPVILCGPAYDGKSYSPRPLDRCEWKLGNDFLAANSPPTLRWCFALARWASIPVLLVCGYLGHRLTRELYGDAASVIFMALWCLTPLLLSWGATTCPAPSPPHWAFPPFTRSVNGFARPIGCGPSLPGSALGSCLWQS